jgi:hypothetical protein
MQVNSHLFQQFHIILYLFFKFLAYYFLLLKICRSSRLSYFANRLDNYLKFQILSKIYNKEKEIQSKY